MISKGDRVATILFVLALLPLAAIGWMQYAGGGRVEAVQSLRQQVSQEQQKAARLERSASAVAAHADQLTQLNRALIQPEGGSPYAQILLLTEGVRRSSGARFPTYVFGTKETLGTLPRYSINGTAIGSEAQVLGFIRGLEEGPNRVQTTSITWQNGAEVTASLSMLYTGAPAEQPASPAAAPAKP